MWIQICIHCIYILRRTCSSILEVFAWSPIYGTVTCVLIAAIWYLYSSKYIGFELIKKMYVNKNSTSDYEFVLVCIRRNCTECCLMLYLPISQRKCSLILCSLILQSFLHDVCILVAFSWLVFCSFYWLFYVCQNTSFTLYASLFY
jgi:FtsH-binding integral membrane protein